MERIIFKRYLFEEIIFERELFGKIICERYLFEGLDLIGCTCIYYLLSDTNGVLVALFIISALSNLDMI